jgi:integrase
MAITKLGPNHYRIEVDQGRRPDGSRARIYETVRGRKRDAEERERAIRHQLDTGLDFEPAKLTVGEWLEHWLTDFAAPKVSPRTLAAYKSTVKIMSEFLGTVPLRDLRAVHIQRALAAYMARGRSRRSARKHFVVLKGALRRAVRMGLIHRNPADVVEPPKPERHEMRTASPETLQLLLDGCRDPDLRRMIYVLVQTGLRAGELLGLKWHDIDWEHATIQVLRARNKFEPSGFGEPKARSRRAVAVSPATLETLREHRAAQHERRLLIGKGWRDLDLIFPRADGSPEDVNNLSKRFGALRKRLGIEGLRVHDLRHTSATLALQAGVHPKIVQERLGHANIGVTLDTYSHVLPNMQREAADALDALVPQPKRGAS